MTILVLGATGLLGNAVFRRLSELPERPVYGTIRTKTARQFFNQSHAERLIEVSNLEDVEELERLFKKLRPEVTVNCIAVGRHTPPDPIRSIMVHAVLPQRLSYLCRSGNSRLIQISSDGVFSGARGCYTEEDLPDANDSYGISKLLGEITDAHAITVRTSIIGHEVQTKTGLLEWFLSKENECRCYTRAIFSGFPSIVLADILRDHIIPRTDLCGVYHVASAPISKFDLLALIARRYGKEIRLIPDDGVALDRSLNAARFAKATGYNPPQWPQLIDIMFRDKLALRSD